VELLLGDFFQRNELVNTGVIDQDVDLAECFLCFGEESLDVCFTGDVALDSDSFSAALTDFVDDAVGIVFCGRVVNNYRCPFLPQLFGDARADPFRRSRHNCDFSV
jgi:hypothetical protein